MLRKKRFYFLVFIVLPLTLFVAYALHRIEPYKRNQWTDEQLLSAFLRDTLSLAEIGFLESKDRKIRYVQIGADSTKPLLVFVHGSPSSTAFWVKMMQDSALQERANLLAVDRPGYGGSGLGRALISVKKQARYVADVIRNRRLGDGQPVILHGSSYGGTVSARIAMDYPDLIDGLLLQSASTAPREEYTYWITHPTSRWPLNRLIPPALRTANNEKLNHQEQLEDMIEGWDRIDASTVVLHGTDDWLIYPPNAYYSCDMLTNAEPLVHHMVENGEHDLIYRTPKLLKRYLHKLLDDVAETYSEETRQK